MQAAVEQQVPVYTYGSSEYDRVVEALYPLPIPRQTEEECAADAARNAAARAALSACILIGPFGQYTGGQHLGATSLDCGTPITGVATGGAVAFNQIVWARAQYEPETRNAIGDNGGYRDVPNLDGIAAATRRAIAAVRAPA